MLTKFLSFLTYRAPVARSILTLYFMNCFRNGAHGAAIDQSRWSDMTFIISQIISLIQNEGWEDLYDFEGYDNDAKLENDAENLLQVIKETTRGTSIKLLFLFLIIQHSSVVNIDVAKPPIFQTRAINTLKNIRS